MTRTVSCRVYQNADSPLDERAEDEEYGRLSGTLAIPLGQRGITFQLAPAYAESGVVVTLTGDLSKEEMLDLLHAVLDAYNNRPYRKTAGVLEIDRTNRP
jgi:hypothetical protein